MMSESGRVFVAGSVLIGALTLTALELRFGNRESAANEADGRIDTAIASAARPITPGTPDTSIDDPQNAGIARVLQAVHDSLQSGDLASAHVLLDAVLTMRKNEPQALLLQKELIARETAARAARQTQATVSGEPASTKPHTHLHASARASYARPATSHRATDTANDDDAAMDAQLPTDSIEDVVTATTVHVTATSSPQTQPQPETIAAPIVQAAASTAEPADKPIAPAVTSTAQNDVSPAAARNAPKTRAEVRDELSRARRNGTMSRFGNPDPYGPGGAASRSAQPLRTW